MSGGNPGRLLGGGRVGSALKQGTEIAPFLPDSRVCKYCGASPNSCPQCLGESIPGQEVLILSKLGGQS